MYIEKQRTKNGRTFTKENKEIRERTFRIHIRASYKTAATKIGTDEMSNKVDQWNKTERPGTVHTYKKLWPMTMTEDLENQCEKGNYEINGTWTSGYPMDEKNLNWISTSHHT